MKKKTITIAILVVFLTATLLPSSVYAAKSMTILGADPPTIDEPMGPDDKEEIEITVGYKLDMNKLIFNLFKFTRIGRILLFGFGKFLFYT